MTPGTPNARPTLVVAVSGPSGAGKTTLVRGLVDALVDDAVAATAVFFDDYADQSRLPEHDLSGWLTRGGDPDEWRTDAMIADIAALARGDRYVPPDGSRIGPVAVIIVEEPFGRARSSMRPLVDLALHLDLPLHIALARRIAREFGPSDGAVIAERTDWLRGYLTLYQEVGAAAYRRIDALARTSCDIRLDGLVDPAALIIQAAHAITARTRTT